MIAVKPPISPVADEASVNRGTILHELPALTRLKALRALPAEERYRIMRESSEAAADEYRDDLAKPPHERDLTVFTALDGADPFHEDTRRQSDVTWTLPRR